MKKVWETKTLGDFFDITSSKRVFKSDWTSVGVPFYRAREIVSLSKNKPLKDPIFISSEMYEEYASKYGKPEEGDILVTGVGTLGICYVVKKNDKFYFKDGNIIWLKNISNVNTKFVEYFFKSKELIDQINSAPMGATVGTFTIVRAKNTTISIPSESEQKRIVNILDKKFGAIEQLKKIAKEQLSNSKEIFDSRLNEVFALNNKYEQIFVGDVLKLEYGKPLDRSERSSSGTYPVYGANGIKAYSEKYFYNDKGIVVGRKGSAGEVNLTNDKFWPLDVTYFVSYETKCSDLVYLFYLLKSLKLQQYATGVKPGLNRNDAYAIRVNKHTLSEQKAFVKELDELSEKTKELELIFQSKIADLEELKKSYLHEAFSGNL